MKRKEKFIVFYNNGYIDILIGKEILEDIGYKYSPIEAFESDSYKNGWLYEITIGNIIYNSEDHDYSTEYWTEFDILKIVPLRYIGKCVKTKSELYDIELDKIKKFQKDIQDFVKSQTKDGLKWDLCKIWSGLGIHTVQGETFTTYKMELKFEDDSLTWSNLNYIKDKCMKFFNVNESEKLFN